MRVLVNLYRDVRYAILKSQNPSLLVTPNSEDRFVHIAEFPPEDLDANPNFEHPLIVGRERREERQATRKGPPSDPSSDATGCVIAGTKWELSPPAADGFADASHRWMLGLSEQGRGCELRAGLGFPKGGSVAHDIALERPRHICFLAEVA